MKTQHRVILTGAITFPGAVLLLGLTVYPFQYGFVESALLGFAFVGLAVFEFVLDDSSF